MKLKLLILILSTLSIFAQGNQKAVITFDTVSDMVTRGNPRNPAANVVQVLGYNNPHDGGGGTFTGTNTATGIDNGIRFSSAVAGWGWERVRNFDKLSVKFFGATDGGGDDRDSVVRAISALDDYGTLDLGSDIHLSAGVTIPNSNIIVEGGMITCTAIIDGPMVTFSGANVFVDGIYLDGSNLSQRGFYQAPGAKVVWENCGVIRCFQSTGQTAVPCGWRIAGETDTVMWNCYVNGVNAAQNGNSVGVFISAIGSEGPPVRFNMLYTTITNVVPLTDGDAWRLQNDWTSDCGVLLVGNHLSGSKRGIKSMSPGGRAFYNHIYSSGYAAISCYASNWDYGWNTSHNDAGDMAFEVGSSVLSLTNVTFSFNTSTRDPNASILLTGDGGRMTGINNQNVEWIGNTWIGHRIGLNVTGGNHGTIVHNNRFFDIGQNAIRFAKQTVTLVDYFPLGATISGNQFTNITSTPISIIDGTDMSVYANLLRGNGTVLGVSTCTNILQFGNFSKTDIGWHADQFALSTAGIPVVKDGALLTNIQATSIGIDRSAPGNGGGIAFRRSANFLYGTLIDNESSGASARAGHVLQNDLDQTVTFQLTSSTYTTGTNQAQFVSSSTNVPFRFYVQGSEMMSVTKDGAFTISNPYGPSWVGSLKIPTEGDIHNMFVGQTNAAAFSLGDMTTDILANTNRNYWVPLYDGTIVGVIGSVSTVSSSGVVTYDINLNGTTVMATSKIVIDANETSTITAATAPVLTTVNFSAGDKFTFDIDTPGTGAKGPQLGLYWKRR